MEKNMKLIVPMPKEFCASFNQFHLPKQNHLSVGWLGLAILTAEISKATFDMTPGQYKKFKKLKRENLRDHMDDLELILTMLGEATTTRITTDRNSKGVPKLKKDARDGGKVAGRTRKDIEKQTGKKISTRKNFLPLALKGKIINL